MDQSGKPVLGNELKIFDPRDPSTENGGAELLDASVVQRGERWWMYLGGQAHGYGPTDIFSASLPKGAPLSATGWKPTRDPAGQLVPVAGQSASHSWDGSGGRYCPAYVRGWIHKDPHGWNGSTTRVRRRTSGDRTRLVSWNGMAPTGSTGLRLHLLRMRIGSTAASMNRISSTTTENGKCGMFPAQIRKTISYTDMRKVKTVAPGGASIRFLPHPR